MEILTRIEKLNLDHHGEVVSIIQPLKKWVQDNIEVTNYELAIDHFHGAIETRFRNCAPDWEYLVFIFSRDALKSIRPNGWEPIGCNDDLIGGFSGGWKFTMYNVTSFIDRRHKVTSAYCKTEELAELHAIIQAIAYERQSKNLWEE